MSCRVYERAPEIKELGVGVILLPHAMREVLSLEVDKEREAAGIENVENRGLFFDADHQSGLKAAVGGGKARAPEVSKRSPGDEGRFSKCREQLKGTWPRRAPASGDRR